jgi:hypothetical protein
MTDEAGAAAPQKLASRGKIWWYVLAAALGGLGGTSLVLSYRPVTGPPNGTFWALFLLPVLQLLVSWPVAVAFVAVLFRKEVAELFPRIERGPLGLRFKAIAAAQREVSGSADVTVGLLGVSAVGEVGTLGVTKSGEVIEPAKNVTIPAPTATAAAEALPPGVEAAAEGLPFAIGRAFRMLNQTVALDKPPEERLTEALRMLAVSQVSYAFEKVYRVITGSQIDALLFLHARPWGAPEQGVKEIYRQNPETAKVLTPEAWWEYLNASALVVVENGVAFITPVGEDFLDYLLRQRYTDRKPY